MQTKIAVGRWIAGGSIVFPLFSLSLPAPLVRGVRSSPRLPGTPIKIFTWRVNRARWRRTRALLPISACCRRRVEVKEPHGPR